MTRLLPIPRACLASRMDVSLFESVVLLLITVTLTTALSAQGTTLQSRTARFNETGEIGSLRLKKGERFQIIIREVPAKGCFIFNREILAPPPDPAGLAAAMAPQDIVLTFDHTGAPGYRVTATLRADDPTCKTNFPNEPVRSWTVRIETLGWHLGFAGAFTIDSLTSDRFFLKPLGTTNGEGQSQFEAMSTTEDADDFTLGAAAMIHVYNNEWDAPWAPISFGLGVNTDSKARYFVGSSLRLEDKFFFTAGAVFGSVDVMPAQLAASPVTTDPNALQNLGSRTKAGFFFSLSFNFGNVNAASFAGTFEEQSPKN